MKVEKKIFAVVLFSLFCAFASGQSKEVSAANKKTAERCLKIAENCVLNQNWESALSNAELGLAYDESISDLIYIKAMAQNNLECPRSEILKTIQIAFEKDSWLNYNRNGARILYADLLSEVGDYSQSNNVLNSKPLIYSADAELIRIKNYYRMGTLDSVHQARVKLNTARKIYPKDLRFPQLFFTFEMLFMNYAQLTQGEYEVPELVQTIADAYINTLPDYDTSDTETAIIALMFADGEQQQRLLKAIGEIDKNNPLYALAALKTGIMSEEQAYNLFIESSYNSYQQNILEAFSLLITNPGLKTNFHDVLNSFSGMLYIDENLDLRNELVIQYERGRPKIIKYDENNDQILEMNVFCDFGAPTYITFENENINLAYGFYPSVREVALNQKSTVFFFLNEEYSFLPFEMTINKIFANFDVDFYIPYVNQEILIPEDYYLAKKASGIEIKTEERMNSKAIFTVFDGAPVFATFMDGANQFAYASMEFGYPFVRYVDYDLDGVYETTETYDLYSDDYRPDEITMKMVQKIFGENTFSKSVYLKKVEIDRNSDTIIEYKEEFLGKNGKLSYWDNDGNGLWDFQYIRYPSEEGQPLIEESIFYGINGVESVLLRSENGIPVSIKYDEKVDKIVTGAQENCFWLMEQGNEAIEAAILKLVGSKLVNGQVQIVQLDEEDMNTRYTVIRVDSSYYLKKVDPYQLEDSAE